MSDTPAAGMWALTITRPRAEPVIKILLPGQYTIGRQESCNIEIPGDENLSRVHCRLDIPAVASQKLLLHDLKSRNGTFVDSKEVHPDSPLNVDERSVIKIGETTITLQRV